MKGRSLRRLVLVAAILLVQGVAAQISPASVTVRVIETPEGVYIGQQLDYHIYRVDTWSLSDDGDSYKVKKCKTYNKFIKDGDVYIPAGEPITYCLQVPNSELPYTNVNLVDSIVYDVRDSIVYDIRDSINLIPRDTLIIRDSINLIPKDTLIYDIRDSLRLRDSIVYDIRDSVSITYIDSIRFNPPGPVDTTFTYNGQEYGVTLTWRLGVGDTNYTLEQWAMLVSDSVSGPPQKILFLDNIISYYDWEYIALSGTNTIGSWGDWFDNGNGEFVDFNGTVPTFTQNERGEYEWGFQLNTGIELVNDSIKFQDRSNWAAVVKLGSKVGTGMLLQKGSQVSFSIDSGGYLQSNIGPNSTCTWNYQPKPYDMVAIQQAVGYARIYANGEEVTKRSGGSTENAGVDDVYWVVGRGDTSISKVLFLDGEETTINVELMRKIAEIWPNE